MPSLLDVSLLSQHIDCWIFDLDNTLYSPKLGIFAQIDVRMGAFIMQIVGCDATEARTIQKRYFHDHGTTLAGMMRHHGVAADDFLEFVHDIDLANLEPDAVLRETLSKLPGSRHIFTNADASYATRILTRIGIDDLFQSIVDIRATDYSPKPEQDAYGHLFRLIPDMQPTNTLFVDDMSRNLRPAHALGITTVWLDNGSEAGNRDHDPAHVDHHINNLHDWLRAITGC
ncbi:pyrimidine 5'-nucleotidase [Sphingomonas lacunae]|uniref:Pyrimidine 5'-nucleotidase n=1 Tax=Sphingomonas lacunae TaxID=2698828 RepID=A0A6M4ASA0_9SPHN|nr:pyrimidine 5'-nucleotidase [Sphingomonas lacunae]QJQ31924.1 pyrimidine 5'-nucleotidase [Sphingomonas lacunae]